MTMTRSQSRKQGKGFRNFPENLIGSNEQQQLGNNQCDKAAHESDTAGWGRSVEGDIDRLLLLAECAELAEQTENIFTEMCRDDQNTGSNNSIDEQISQENVVNATADGVQRSGCSNGVTGRPRLSQLRKQARQNPLLLDEEESKYCQCHLDGEAIRLSKKKRKAQCIDTNNLSSQEMVTGEETVKLPGSIRLRHIKRLARLLGQSTWTDNKSEGNKKEKPVARQTGKEVLSQTEGNHVEVASRKAQKRSRNKSSNPPEIKTVASAAHNSLREIDQPSAAFNSETQKEASSAKRRTRSTKLRCEVCSGNQSSDMRRPDEN